MSTKEDVIPIKFKGKLKYAVLPPRPARKAAAEYVDPKNPEKSTYSVQVECTAEQFKKLQKAGIPKLTTLREYEGESETYIQIKATKVTGEYVFDDPIVVDKYGNLNTEEIGNGSTGVVIAELTTGKGGKKALRLKAVTVLDRVEVHRDELGKYRDMMELDESEDPTVDLQNHSSDNEAQSTAGFF